MILEEITALEEDSLEEISWLLSEEIAEEEETMEADEAAEEALTGLPHEKSIALDKTRRAGRKNFNFIENSFIVMIVVASRRKKSFIFNVFLEKSKY